MTLSEGNRVSKNIIWIMAGGVANSLLAFVGSVVIARFLDMSNYGVLQLAITYFLLIQTFENVVHPNVIKTQMLQKPALESEYVAATFLIIFAVFSVFEFLLLATYFVTRENIYLYLAIMTVGQIFRASNSMAFKFDINLESKKTQLSQMFGFFVANLYRIAAAILCPAIIPQAFSIGIGSLVNAVSLFGYAGKSKLNISWPKHDIIVDILRASLPMLLVSLITFLVYKADILILGFYSLDRDISLYSNAVKLSEPWTFVAAAFTNSMMPAIVLSRSASKNRYYKKIQRLFFVLIWLSVIMALVGTIFSSFIVNSTYGHAYQETADILKIHIWSNVFLFIMAAQQLWEINESMKHFLVLKMSLGAVINIGLNFIFIPMYGGMACAVISVLTYFLISIGFNFFHKKALFLNYQILRALLDFRHVGQTLKSIRTLLHREK